jgi:pyruvate/2-oxoglutarate/acetoin dehydrogenase E1 component
LTRRDLDGGSSTGLLGQVTERGLHDLDDAWIVATDETPVPYSSTLEDALMPDAAQITAEVRERLGASVTHYDGVLTAASTP